METIILKNWLYYSEGAALEELKKLDMGARNRMAAEMQRFADWLALENSRALEKVTA